MDNISSVPQMLNVSLVHGKRKKPSIWKSIEDFLPINGFSVIISLTLEKYCLVGD